MKQETNTAATTLEQVNAMPAATWGWLKMNQTKLELSNELAAAPAEAVEVEGLDEQLAGSADAFDAAMDAMAERFPERRASAPGDAADRARITPETELDVPATSVYQAGAIKLEEELSPAEAFETGMGEAAYAYLTEHATKRIVIDVPAYQHAAVTVRVSGVDAAAAIAAIDVVARPQATLDLALALDSPVAGEGVVGSVLRVCANEYATVNVSELEVFENGTEVTSAMLVEKKIIRKELDGLKVLGNGELTKKLTVKAVKFTGSAKEKIEAVGGTAEVI